MSNPIDSMNIEVRFTPAMIESAIDVHGRTAVVVDTLRATSTIVAALMSGAREIVPVATPSDAVVVAQRLGTERTLLCGERGTVKVEGFHLGNSPLEYTPGVVRGKTLVMTTTNGTQALMKAMPAQRVLCGALVNASATAQRLIRLGLEHVVFICSGTRGHFSFEDAVATGAIISAVARIGQNLRLDDGARASAALFELAAPDLRAAIASGDHGQTLREAGMEADIAYCARLDIDDAPVPTLVGSTIRLDEALESSRTL